MGLTPDEITHQAFPRRTSPTATGQQALVASPSADTDAVVGPDSASAALQLAPTNTRRPGAAAPSTATENTMSLFASDLDGEPLFSDNANDLLDGTNDDVMGNLADEGDRS